MAPPSAKPKNNKTAPKAASKTAPKAASKTAPKAASKASGKAKAGPPPPPKATGRPGTLLPSQENNNSGFGKYGIPTWGLFETNEVGPSANNDRVRRITYEQSKNGRCVTLRDGKRVAGRAESASGKVARGTNAAVCGPGTVRGTEAKTVRRADGSQRCYTYELFKPAALKGELIRRPVAWAPGPCRVGARYTPFSTTSEGNAVYAPRRLTQNEQQALLAGPGPPPVCGAEIAAAGNRAFDPVLDACFKRDLAVRSKPLMDRIAAGAWLCDKDNERPKLGPHQNIIYEFAKMLAAAKTPAAVGGRRGLLVWHNTGSGKTVSSMGIIASYWNTPKKIVLCTTNSNMRSNDMAEYAQNALMYFPREAAEIFKSVGLPPVPAGGVYSRNAFQANGGNNPLSNWARDVGAPVIKRRVQSYSFWVLGSKDKGTPVYPQLATGEGSVLIVDESQNIFKPTAKLEVKACANLKAFLQTPAAAQKITLFSLTATPGDTAQELTDMLNIVKPVKQPALTVASIAANPGIARGLIAYADIRGDKTHYGELTGGGARNIEVPHGPKYYAAYLSAFGAGGGGKAEIRDLTKNPEKATEYYLKSRVAGCMLGLTAAKAFYGEDDLAKIRAQKPVPGIVTINSNTQMLLSDKFKIALGNAMRDAGNQYVYVPDVNTLKAAVSALKAAGVQQFKGANAGKGTPGPGLRFYAYYAGTMDGEVTTVDQNKAVQKLFKSKENLNGQLIKIFVTTVYEGLDLWYLRGVHLVAPLPTKAMDDQAVGRALRYCGHSGGARTVNVYRYLGVAPGAGATADALAAADSGGGGRRPRGAAGRLESVKAAEAALKKLNDSLGGYSARPGARDANTYVYYDSIRRSAALDAFEKCLKSVSIECGIMDAIQFGGAPRCGGACSVKVTASGQLATNAPPPRAAKAGGGLFGGASKSSSAAPAPGTPSQTARPSAFTTTTSTAARPSTSVARPSTSAARPSTSVARPSSARPSTSAARPSTSSARPSTSSARPSTSAARRPTSTTFRTWWQRLFGIGRRRRRRTAPARIFRQSRDRPTFIA
jgi:hypothetical protein